MNICSICSRQYTYSHKAGHTTTKCNSCLVNKRRFGIKDKAIEYKGGKCIVCGYNRCKRVMIFHHTDNTKEFGIGGSYSRSWKSIQNELDKCVLLCANCHGEVHSGLISI